jgi:uncharacterized protein
MIPCHQQTASAAVLTTTERITEAPFQPHPLFRNSHGQTIAADLLRAPRLPLVRERVELVDGDFIDLAHAGPIQPDCPVALLVHGLCGGFHSKSLLRLGAALTRSGWHVVLLQLRGAGPEANRLPHMYHHADTADLKWVARRLRAQFPAGLLAWVGWSLGGSVVLNALAEEGDRACVDVAAAVSVPFHLEPCVQRMSVGFSRIYQWHLLGGLKALIHRKHALHSFMPPVDVRRALLASTLTDFDEAFTAPLHGYRSSAEYYATAACGPRLRDIRRPTLVLHSRDDPFMQESVVPTASELSVSTMLELTRAGGHLGFIGRSPGGRLIHWAEERLFSYLRDQWDHRSSIRPPASNVCRTSRSQPGNDLERWVEPSTNT